VNPLSPANGTVGASAPLPLVDDAPLRLPRPDFFRQKLGIEQGAVLDAARTESKLVDGAYGRPDSKTVAHLRDHVCLAVLSIVRLDERRASSARWSQNPGSLMSMERTSFMGMERALSRVTLERQLKRMAALTASWS
jgi:hypothetical protein